MVGPRNVRKLDLFAVAIAEVIVASNGVYAAVVPFAFGAGTPEVVGELEYYARVSASFRLK